MYIVLLLFFVLWGNKYSNKRHILIFRKVWIIRRNCDKWIPVAIITKPASFRMLKDVSQCPITKTFVFLQKGTMKLAMKVTSTQLSGTISFAWIFEIKKSYLFFTATQVNGKSLRNQFLLQPGILERKSKLTYYAKLVYTS